MLKTFILTADYELYLGSLTGTVEKCMVEPTYKLAELLDLNNSKLTVFWDILHYYRLTELENDYPGLKNDRRLIDEQISFLISKGHDIQLHLHPHWIDAKYKGDEWEFTYDRFKLHSLSENENSEKIDSITGCVTISKHFMEKEIRKYAPEYRVTAFRAGGYLIEPFAKLRRAFELNNIYTDSSVLPGMTSNNPVNGYDFSDFPAQSYYHFTDSPSEFSGRGKFIELPVTTLSIPILKNIIFTFIRRLKYPDLESGRMGTSSSESATTSNKSIIKKIISMLTKPRLTAFTTDGNFSERFNYMYRKAKENSTMILHPKLLNQHTLNILREKLANNDIRFITINNYLNSVE